MATMLIESIYCCLANTSAMYKVKIMPTEAAKRHDLGNGEYTLLLSSLNITLCKPETKMPQLVWPYKYIRRYGKSRNSFTLEAGRKCPNGEGVFTFLTSVGTEVFQRVQEFVRKMKHREHSSIGGPEGVSNVDAASNRSSRSPTPRSPTQLRPTPAKKPASISNTAPGPARNVMDSVSNNNENEKRRYMNVNVSGSVTQKPPPEPEYAVYEVTPQYRHKSDSDRPVANTTYAEPKIPERDAWIKHGMNRDNVHEETYNRTLNQDEDPYYSEVPGGMAALATEFKRNTAIQRLTKARSAPCADEENAYDHVGKGGFSRPSIGEDSTYALPGRLGSKSISGGYSAAAPVKKGRQPKRQNKPTEDSVYCEIGGHH